MAITYPVPNGTLWANMRDSDGLIVSRDRPWPVADGGPIVGAEPGFTMLQQVENAKPEHDERYFVLVETATPFPALNELRKSWSLVDRPLEEAKDAAKNVEMQRAYEVVDLEQEIITLRIIVMVLIDSDKGMIIPDRFKTMVDKFRDEALTLSLNRDRRDELLAQIEAGQKPSMDTGWQEAVAVVP